MYIQNIISNVNKRFGGREDPVNRLLKAVTVCNTCTLGITITALPLTPNFRGGSQVLMPVDSRYPFQHSLHPESTLLYTLTKTVWLCILLHIYSQLCNVLKYVPPSSTLKFSILHAKQMVENYFFSLEFFITT